MIDSKIKVVVAALALGVSQACAAAKPAIVLVHGPFETADVWKLVAERLHKDGYKTVAVTLPGRRGNPLSSKRATLDLYRDAVLSPIAKQTQPVVLVGHSFAGITISNVGEAVPDKIRTLVYVAAYLPASGQSPLVLSQSDPDSKMGPAFRVSDEKSEATVDPAARGELFCNGCNPKMQKTIAAGFVSEPMGPLATPVSVSTSRFGVVDKVYIHTARDLVGSPALQAMMIAATPVHREMTLDTGHAAFAVELAKAIELAAQ